MALWLGGRGFGVEREEQQSENWKRKSIKNMSNFKNNSFYECFKRMSHFFNSHESMTQILFAIKDRYWRSRQPSIYLKNMVDLNPDIVLDKGRRPQKGVFYRQITLRIVGYHFFSWLTATLNLCLIYFKITWAVAILLGQVHKKFRVNRTKIKGGCQSGRKVVNHNSKSDLPLVV